MYKPLEENVQIKLREEKIITETEVAIQFADKFVAENILNKSRRVIHVPTRLLEASSQRRVLKG